MNRIPLKLKHLTFALALTSVSALYAANTKKTVTQVESSVTIDEAVDYHISSSTPFAVSGSIDITNPEAVVVLTGLNRPLSYPHISNLSK